MYNRSIKIAFVETLDGEGSKNNAVSYLEFFASHEEKKEKDIALFSKEEIIEVLENSGIYNAATLRNYISCLRSYRLWYNDNIDHSEISFLKRSLLDEIDFESALVRNIFFSPEELLKKINDGSYLIGKSYIPTLILNWHGLSTEEALQILKSDISFTSKGLFISTGKRKIKIIHPEFCRILKEFYDLEFIDIMGAGGKIIKQEENSVYFLRRFVSPSKPTCNSPMKRSTLNICKFLDRLSEQGKPVNSQIVKLSGEMYELYLSDKKGKDLTKCIQERNPGIASTQIMNKLKTYDVYLKAVGS